jgi:hypothetical protein
MESTDERQLVVKFPSQARRCQFLINEYLAGLLLNRMGLRTPTVTLVDFGPSFERPQHHPELLKVITEAETILNPLICLGMEFAEGYEELGDGKLQASANPNTFVNKDDVCGAVVFDTWIFNQDARHFLGFEKTGGWDLLLFDNDGAFNRDDWLLGDCVRTHMNCTVLADWIRKMILNGNLALFERWFQRLEDDARWADLHDLKRFIPEEWLNRLLTKRTCTVEELLETLDKRRRCIRSIFLAGRVC